VTKIIHLLGILIYLLEQLLKDQEAQLMEWLGTTHPSMKAKFMLQEHGKPLQHKYLVSIVCRILLLLAVVVAALLVQAGAAVLVVY
jgi:hypothetical protein